MTRFYTRSTHYRCALTCVYLPIVIVVCSRFSEILPTLVVCHNLTLAAKPQIKTFFRENIFPAPTVAAETGEVDPPRPDFTHRGTSFYFQHLTFFLTCLDTDVKRYTGEWLFLLCDQNGMCSRIVHRNLPDRATDAAGVVLIRICLVCLGAAADEYTKRTGIGNAIGMLRIKGLA